MRFGILGALTVWTADGHAFAVPGRKIRLLLADLLVQEGRPVSADRLAEDLWGDSPPKNPAGALHTKVWGLRRALGRAEPGAGDLVVFRPPGYLLDVADVEVDARRFQHLLAGARDATTPRARVAALDDALALWRGPALADFADADFAQPIVARLEEQRLTALEDRADALLELGEHSPLAGELADLVLRHPLRERLRMAHMRALYGAGRQAEALAGFDEMRALLAEELGLDPGTELVALRQAILRQDPALARPPRSVPAPALPPAPAPCSGPHPVLLAGRSAKVPNNLPVAMSSLIGRAKAITRVRVLLQAGRLVTLTGIGGVGKTRLALAVAEESAQIGAAQIGVDGDHPGGAYPGDYPDGVWLVELSGVEPGDRGEDAHEPIVDLVATALGVRDEVIVPRPVPSAHRLADALRARRLLLVLDNCEHVVERAARVAEMLLRAAPGVRVLATTREALGVEGERLWMVPPLTLPEENAARAPIQVAGSVAGSTDRAAESSAVALFLDRVRAAEPDFPLDDTTIDAVVEICRRLDGLPLALELAATRVGAMGVHEVAARLADRFALLTVGRRGAPARQRTLRAVFDWSWDLLTEPERVVLRRLSVFSGGCTLRAAEEVCAGDGVADGDGADAGDSDAVKRSEVFDLVARLVDRCLVSAGDVAGQRRYRLPESLAAYCAERLHEAGEADRVRIRHVRFHVELAEWALPYLNGPGQRRRLELIDAESANLQSALEIAVRQGTGVLALRLVNALAWYWFLRGRFGEASRAFTAALAAPGDAPDRAVALAWQAGFRLRAGEPSDPPERYEDLVGGIDDPYGRAIACWFLGFMRTGFGDQAGSERLIVRALAEFRSLDDRWGTAAALAALAARAMLRGDLAAGRRYGEESAEIFRDLGDGWGRLQAMDTLASLAEVQGDYPRAAALHHDGLRVAETLGLWAEVSVKLSGIARIALLDGDHGRARRLHERALRLAREQGYPFGEQFAEVGLGMGARREGGLDEAEAHLRRWLEWCRRLDGDPGEALILAELGFVAEQRGDAVAAMRLHLEGAEAARTTGDPRSIALALEGLAGALALAGRHVRAAQLLGAATAARDKAGAPLPPAERGDVTRIGTAVREALGVEFQHRFEQGRALDPVRALMSASGVS
ncbi:BTAD domain-containing putative transcriptional regulator [Sphaerimonospora thailandensis]|uniref:BTAD domain-containing putative transcriptional regulator n=1 Tax=Sphaerimonospora thailandensis TaxID=795644 RepID=UPI00194E2159|nr:BTAD domain-containing putative transcriptional regulator [Sphaerimonospora thailandensis]